MTQAQRKKIGLEVNALILEGKMQEAANLLTTLNAPEPARKGRGRPKKVAPVETESEEILDVVEVIPRKQKTSQEEPEYVMNTTQKNFGQWERFQPPRKIVFADYGAPHDNKKYPPPIQRRPPAQTFPYRCCECNRICQLFASQIPEQGSRFKCNSCVGG